MVHYRVSVGLVSSLLVVVAVTAAIVLTDVVSAASRPLGWAVASATIALLLSPIVAFVERGLPHWLAVVVSLLLVAVTLGGIWIGVSATLVDNVDQLRRTAPTAAADLEARYQIAEDFQLQRRVRSFVDDLDQRFGAEAEVRHAASTAPTYVVTGVLMLFLLIYGPRLVEGGLGLIDEPARRERARAVIDQSVASGRAYLLLAIAKAVTITLISWVVFALVGLDASFVLGLIVGCLSVIPDLGIVLGGLPAMLFAAIVGADAFWLVVALIVGLQLLDALVIQPRVEQRTIHVGPALLLVVGLIGWEMYGLGGALYSSAVLVLLVAVALAVIADGEGPDVADANASTTIETPGPPNEAAGPASGTQPTS